MACAARRLPCAKGVDQRRSRGRGSWQQYGIIRGVHRGLLYVWCVCCACRYHRYSIQEASNKFVLTTHAPGEAQVVQEALHAAFQPDMKR